MKIAIVYQYYQGTGSPGHSLIYELAQFLAGRGHEVTVVSGETGYMQRDTPTLPWYRRLRREERDGPVRVLRTFTYSELHRSYLGRLLSFASFSLSGAAGLVGIDKVDLVLASTPPIFPMFAAALVCRLRRVPLVIEVRDLWPESAVQMGILRNPALIRIMAWMERQIYDQSARIVALTEGIRDDIRARGWPEEKLEVVTCGVDFGRLYPDPQGAARTRRTLGWEERKIVLYFGALGEANNIPVILRAARSLRERSDVLFVLVGDGLRRTAIEQEVADGGLTNVSILQPVAKDLARVYLSAADLCLVTLKDIPLFDGAIPTKLIDYMACARPVLCGIRGEARRILDSAQAGLGFNPDDDRQLAGLIRELLADPRRCDRLGANGLAYVQSHFSAEMMRAKMEGILRAVAGTTRAGNAAADGVR
ncbi:glycosyltransferase family 4 protein [Accumulibacter sp.]|uniref:glycosyltransferase family 4 protein n=1 Tax=Accumulibacter sp. TaxID=2053492 RepID=UPI0025D5684B|nr:glycosyltransferase family 4 protein [Accumulibacter sp.]MCM8612122.1 glycosyltransferase family 4 protein [Accumulibacter sp.]MCM8635788.1 glycosyltransferase family 4 protein [Accumulibacter sp.]MCM8639575.1 glycosyltransferase family 4 protein [Accumulibacter sp.]